MSYSIDRLIWQYRDKPNVRALIASVLHEFDNISEALDDLRTRLDIDASVGMQLDGIGEIIGQPRPTTTQIADVDVFAFDGPNEAKGMSGVGRQDEGGRFIGLGGLIIGAMPDDEYRMLLRATIISNDGLSDVDHILRYCLNITSAFGSVSESVGYISVTLPRPVSAPEAALIRNTMPIAAGVRLGYLAYTLEGVVGFGMGSVSFPSPDALGGFDDTAGSGVEYSGTWAGLT